MKKILIIFLLLAITAAYSVAEDKGPLISVELRDVELKDVLRAIGQEHMLNIIVDEKVTGKVTVSLRNVPLWDAVSSILKGKGYTYVKEDNIVRVVPLAEDEELFTKALNVKYANPKEIEPMIKKVLTKKGDVATDPRTNTIIIKDIPSAIASAEKLIQKVDVRTGQVMIEAKIVEVNTNAKKELGIQWGTIYTNGDFIVHGGGIKDKTSDIDTKALTQGIGVLGSAMNVNLPAGVGLGTGGALGLGILSKNLTLDLQLSALEEAGNAKVLSSPKVMVADNQEATIASGTQILIATNTTTTTGTTTGTSTSTTTGTTSANVTEKEASLRLTVTPRVIDSEQVSLKILTRKEEFDFSRPVLGIPPKNSRETQTNLIVRNGETIVIGGIYTENDFEGESGVPLISKIPLLGWLFKKETKTKSRTELLVFITPYIQKEKFDLAQ